MEKNLLSIYNEMINQLDNVWKGEKNLGSKADIVTDIFKKSKERLFILDKYKEMFLPYLSNEAVATLDAVRKDITNLSVILLEFQLNVRQKTEVTYMDTLIKWVGKTTEYENIFKEIIQRKLSDKA